MVRRDGRRFLRIAVCEDEEVLGETIRSLLASEAGGDEVELYHAAEELLASRKRYDLIFFDVLLPGMNGLEAARRIRREDARVQIVFLSSAREYAIEAFDVAALHYLIKPIRPEKLREVCERARTILADRGGDVTRILQCRTAHGSTSVPVRQVRYAESAGKYVDLHLTGETLRVMRSMRDLSRELGGAFFRSHRSFLVNLGQVASYRRDEIILKGGERIFLARDRYPDFVRAYEHFLEKEGRLP